MPLLPTKYKAKCDVSGCDKATVGSLGQLSNAGWTTRVILQGKVTAEDIIKYHPSHLSTPGICMIVCPECTITGKYKQ